MASPCDALIGSGVLCWAAACGTASAVAIAPSTQRRAMVIISASVLRDPGIARSRRAFKSRPGEQGSRCREGGRERAIHEIEPVLAPEQLVADGVGRRAEHAALERFR